MKIDIVIPCFNESLNIKNLVDQAKDLKENFNFVFVNNGSTDQTDSIFKDLKMPYNCKYINVVKNKGYGNGIKEGLKKTNSSLIGWMHGDLQQDLKILNNVIPILKNTGANKNFFIKGLRTKRKFFDIFFTVCMALLMTIIFKKIHWDIAGQPTLIKRKYLKQVLNAPNDFSFDFYIYNFFIMKNFQTFRFDAPFIERKYGKSSWNKGFISKIKHSIKSFKYIIHLKKNNLIV
jgi:glycosyltransferase involved in cell wall biosynthesis